MASDQTNGCAIEDLDLGGASGLETAAAGTCTTCCCCTATAQCDQASM